MNNLLAQRKEIERLRKEDGRRQREVEEEESDRGAEEKERAIVRFERTMMGLEGGARNDGGQARSSGEGERSESRGVKRKFELDGDEMLRNAKRERAEARKALDEEKVRIQRFMFCIGAIGRLTVSRLLSQRFPPSGCHLSRRPRITPRRAKPQSYRPSVQPRLPKINTLCRSNP